METALKYKASLILNNLRETKGILKITKDYLIFEPLSKEFESVKEAIYRIVQTGFRKRFYLIPYKFYIKTMSGKVLYFKTVKAREIYRIIEKAIY
jgi:hypothetical protein